MSVHAQHICKITLKRAVGGKRGHSIISSPTAIMQQYVLLGLLLLANAAQGASIRGTGSLMGLGIRPDCRPQQVKAANMLAAASCGNLAAQERGRGVECPPTLHEPPLTTFVVFAGAPVSRQRRHPDETQLEDRRRKVRSPPAASRYCHNLSVYSRLPVQCLCCSCPAEVVYQKLGDLTTEQLQQQQQRLEDQEQQQQPLVMGMADTANAVGFSFLLSVSAGPQAAST